MARKRTKTRMATARDWLARLPRYAPAIAVASFSVLPFLFFANERGNIVDVSVGQALPIALLSLLIGLALWGLSWLVFRDWTRAAVLAVLLSFPVFHFRTMVVEFLELFPGVARPSLILYPLIAVLAVIVILLLRRTKFSRGRTLANYFAVLGVILLAYQLVVLGIGLERNTGADVRVQNEDLVRAADAAAEDGSADRPEQAPDIYYLVFDRYGGQIGLSESYGFSNGPFVRSLEDRGFFVADASFANYPITASSLASSLNGGLLETTGRVDDVRSRQEFYPLIKRPEAGRFLQEHGYQHLHVGSWWGPSQTIASADQNYETAWRFGPDAAHIHASHLASVYLVGTMLVDLQEKAFGPFQVENQHGTVFNRQFATLEALAARAGEAGAPRLVTGHILMPHPPFAFDAQGRTEIDRSKGARQNFLDQLAYTNTRIEQTVDAILAAYPADRKPVIVLTADEGEYPYVGGYGVDDTDVNLREKSNILNAFYFPSGDYADRDRSDSPYDTMTAVNNFRVIFNRFFDAGLPLQPDRIFTVRDVNRPYTFVDVTDRVRAEPGPPGSGIVRQ
ncbi:MAG: hypothetical protein WD603_00630 [Patescibacteria group bacterium]